MAYSTDDPRVPRAAALARQGKSRQEIAAEFGVSPTTASRLVHAGGERIRIPGGKKTGKKPLYLSRVLELHEQGKTVNEIADVIQDIHFTTVAQWLRDEGKQPAYRGQTRIAQESQVDPRQEEALSRYLSGESAPAISKDMGLSERTVEWWAKRAGVWEQGGIFKRHRDAAKEVVRLYREGEKVSNLVGRTVLDYYQIRIALDKAGVLAYPDSEKPKDRCPCGKLTGRPNRKYCSPEHRTLYGKKKRANPENYVTFECLNCEKEVTRYKNYGNGHNKYCSNECAQKHTKIKKHIVVDDAIVLDSGYEALFWGLCTTLKIPIERFDRQYGVAWREDCWYAPDFWLPTLGTAVELKGLEDAEDELKWAAYREQRGALKVFLHMDLVDMIPAKGDVIATITKTP